MLIPGHLLLAKWNDWKLGRKMERRFDKIVKAASKEDFLCRVILPELEVHWRTMSVPALVRDLDFYVSPELLGFSITKAVLILMHEVRHLAYDHDKRTIALYTKFLDRTNRTFTPAHLQKIVKICADAEINHRLVAMGYDIEPYGMVVFRQPEWNVVMYHKAMEDLAIFIIAEGLDKAIELTNLYDDGMGEL